MRATTMIRRMLGMSKTVVEEIDLKGQALIVTVRPQWQKPRCGSCGTMAPQYERKRKPRRWRHLGMGSMKVFVEYRLRRVSCPSCQGVKTERVPWARPGSDFTRDFEELTGFLAQSTDKTTVKALMGISWRTVGSIVDRLLLDYRDPEKLRDLKRIGVDEFSYRRRHRYVTVIVDQDTGEVVWVEKGHGAKALKRFFRVLGKEGRKKIELVSIDMAAGYKKAVRDHLRNAQIVFDRFHVQRVVGNALDEMRRELLREKRGTPEGKRLFKSRFALLRRWFRTREEEEEKLEEIRTSNQKLYRGYMIYQDFADVLDIPDPAEAQKALKRWMAWAARSRLRPFVKAGQTIRKHLDGILLYFRSGRMTNARVEGINNRIRVIARRAYGFHSAEALISMIFLCCGGITLNPPLPA
ncbi:MAG: ISL3 family transposase [Acidobacteriota bacterium]